MTLSKPMFAEVTTLSQKLIFARIAENNRDRIFSKFLLDAGCDNLPKSQNKNSFKKVWVTSFCFFTVDMSEQLTQEGNVYLVGTYELSKYVLSIGICVVKRFIKQPL